MKPAILFLVLVMSGLTIYIAIQMLRQRGEAIQNSKNTPRGPVGFKQVPPEALCS